ncbi:apolipoprotein N-acyltransferase [Amycolatopsis sp.]|uniref:apolipoprotein N-acyltransferase n=1 Tax=Amycolatopsis sp. TaxID=37632 RepID=UPI002E09AE67|nr:apolipoprotein N-acyltransferase [Amycolatopsis sp.]
MSTTAVDEASAAPEEPPRRRRFSRAWLLRFAASGVSGFGLYLSFAPRPLWWLAPLAFTGLALVLRGRSFRGAFGYGYVFGVAFFLPLLTWLQAFLGPSFGPWPWLGLSAVLALYLALVAGLITLVTRLPLAPVWAALLVIAAETPRAWFPLGGFPWGRVAFSQPEGAFLPLASVGGAPLVGFAVVLTGFGIAALIRTVFIQKGRTREWRRLAVPLAAALVPAIAGLALWPTIGTEAQDGTLTVAAVQGNAPDVGIALEGMRGVLRANHLAESQVLLTDIRAGRVPKPDLLIWPETATALRGDDPGIDQMVASFGIPAIIGAQTWRPDGGVQNSAIAWDPVTGPGKEYNKSQLVPFGEYVPARDLARLVTPFVDDTSDMTPGDRTNAALDVAGTKVGVFICYEAAFDHPARDAVAQGAELLVVPTNNAWYGPGEMSYQQLAMSRLRAVEHGRAVVVSATSGVSAIVRPDGTIARSTGLFTAASLVESVPLRQTTTLSDRLGVWTEYGLVGAALAGLLAGVVLRFRTRRTATEIARSQAPG